MQPLKNNFFLKHLLSQTSCLPVCCTSVLVISRLHKLQLCMVHSRLLARTDAEAEAPIPWPPDVKSWLIGKDPDAGKDWGHKETYGWDGWMASPIQLTWTWANSRRWWGTGKPGVLMSMQARRVRPNWTTASSPLHLPYLQRVTVLWTFFLEKSSGWWKSPRRAPMVLPPATRFILVSLVAQMIKRLPAVRETLVQSLSREDPLEKEMATHSSTLAWKIPWTEDPGRLQSTGSLKTWVQSPGEWNGNPLQYSCLENSMDRRAWQVTDHGVTKSQTQLSN